jgi:hypothetical protein
MTSPDAANVPYVAEFLDGPLEGRVDLRVLVDGKHSPRISMIAAVDSMESVFWYNEVDARDVQGELHVRYAFDPSESDPVESDPEGDLGEL